MVGWRQGTIVALGVTRYLKSVAGANDGPLDVEPITKAITNLITKWEEQGLFNDARQLWRSLATGTEEQAPADFGTFGGEVNRIAARNVAPTDVFAQSFVDGVLEGSMDGMGFFSAEMDDSSDEHYKNVGNNNLLKAGNIQEAIVQTLPAHDTLQILQSAAELTDGSSRLIPSNTRRLSSGSVLEGWRSLTRGFSRVFSASAGKKDVTGLGISTGPKTEVLLDSRVPDGSELESSAAIESENLNQKAAYCKTMNCAVTTLLLQYREPTELVNNEPAWSSTGDWVRSFQPGPEFFDTRGSRPGASSTPSVFNLVGVVANLIKDAMSLPLTGLAAPAVLQGLGLTDGSALTEAGAILHDLGNSGPEEQALLLLESAEATAEVKKLQRTTVMLRLLSQVTTQDEESILAGNAVKTRLRRLDELENLITCDSTDCRLKQKSSNDVVVHVTLFDMLNEFAASLGDQEAASFSIGNYESSSDSQNSQGEITGATTTELAEAVPFKSTYLQHLHMETLEVPSPEHMEVYRKLLAQDPNVAIVEFDEVADFSMGEGQASFDLMSGPQLHDRVEEFGDDHHFSESSKLVADNSDTVPMSQNVLETQRRRLAALTKTPNDNFFNRQWALTSDGANVIEAWRIWSGLENPRKKILVALIDSGVDLSHKDLRGQLWQNDQEICDNGVDDDGNGYIDDCYGWDFVEDDNEPNDEAGHGTASAGIIAARGNNKLGIAPICWNCEILNLRVLDAKIKGTVSAFVKAIDYALAKGAKISNNSYGARGSSFASLRAAVERAEAAGMVFVAAAGNSHSDNDGNNRILPASWPVSNIISVAAVTEAGGLASFSNWGETSVHLAAPGDNVLAPTINGAYQFVAGTSFAVPQVTGIAALIRGKYPSLTAAEVSAAILGSTRPLPALKGMCTTNGIIDAAAALRKASSLAESSSDENRGSRLFGEGSDRVGHGRNSCPKGFTVSSVLQRAGRGVSSECVDRNECEEERNGAGPCPVVDGAVCVNLPGTFDCRCPPGFAWNGRRGEMGACLAMEHPLKGPCANNGSCGINSLCQITRSASAGRMVKCICLGGYTLSDGTCVRDNALMSATEYIRAIA